MPISQFNSHLEIAAVLNAFLHSPGGTTIFDKELRSPIVSSSNAIVN